MNTAVAKAKKSNNLGLFAVFSVLVFGGIFASIKYLGKEDVVSTPNADTGASQLPAGIERKVGVVIVSHGSHSEKWRDLLFATENAVEDRILKAGNVHVVHTAFMEYTEPSIATQLEACDKDGCTDIIVVPLLLTVSGHSFDDIPTICGLKSDAASLATLKAEGTRIYKPNANVVMTPTLDFSALLESNVVRRLAKLSKDPANEGVVLVAYGSTPYDEEWHELMNRMEAHIAKELNIETGSHAWCGHIAHYKKQPTIDAINEVLAKKEKALVLPILVSVSENFQYKIIGGAVSDVNLPERVTYIPDAILPEPKLEDWIVDIVAKTRTNMDSKESAK